ncbi:MAG: hypothetical protein JNK84_05355 [Phreatobacter sp.]|nr:hypothetical protein [Phreatobacter sp.]MBL8568494.1 hypothetical protein [Phreatobacter sp.]
MMSSLLANWPVWIATAALVLVLAENMLGVTGFGLFAADAADADGD